jgi:hypothetical protein
MRPHTEPDNAQDQRRSLLDARQQIEGAFVRQKHIAGMSNTSPLTIFRAWYAQRI